jgi:hypothetical protein
VSNFYQRFLVNFGIYQIILITSLVKVIKQQYNIIWHLSCSVACKPFVVIYMGGRIITTVPVGFYTAPTDWGAGGGFRVGVKMLYMHENRSIYLQKELRYLHHAYYRRYYIYINSFIL